MKLKGKVPIATGGSRGLGKAIAVGFRREGANVVVAARTETENTELPGTIYQTAEEIKALGQDPLAVRCDVTDEQSVNRITQMTIEKFARIDILFNNAEIAFYRSLLETPLKRWELVIRVNLIGAFLCSNAVLPHIIRQNCGSITNVSSLAANEKDEGSVSTGVTYAVSKAGLDRLTWGLAPSWDNTISP